MRLWNRHRDVLLANWHLGFTAFGGPPVQFQTVRKPAHNGFALKRTDQSSFTKNSSKISRGSMSQWSAKNQ